MSNNDWNEAGPGQGGQQPDNFGQPQPQPQQQPPGNFGQPQQPYQQGPGAPPPNHSTGSSGLTEGWGEGASLGFDEIKARFSLVFDRSKGSILKAWIVLGLLPLTLALVGSVLSITAYFAPVIGLVGVIGVAIMNVFLLPVSIALTIAQLSLFKPLHRRIFEDAHVQMGVMDTIESTKGVFFSVLGVSLLAGVASFFGTLLCLIPGLVIGFLLMQSVYLAAGRELGVMDAMAQSYELNKRYFLSVLLVVAAGICSVLVGVAILVPTGFVAAFAEPFGGLLTAPVNWLVMQALSFVAFLVQATIYSCIETKETGKMPV